MDLRNFCVENRRKTHSFPFRSVVHSAEKMSKSFQFGVAGNGSLMEDNCLKNFHNISCNTPFTYQAMAKNEEIQSRKSCFDRFSHLTFSRVVGGFVGSKSQGGSASRELHQVWDVIFRQLADTTYQATMNNNAQQYFSIGEAVSHSIFGQFNNSENSPLDFASFLFARPCDFFANKKKTGNMQASSDNSNSIHNQTNGVCDITEKQMKLNNIPCDEHPLNSQIQNNEEKPNLLTSSKQSYADVAKSFISSRLESPKNSEKVGSLMKSQKNAVLTQHFSRSNDKRDKRNGHGCTLPSYSRSSQNQQRKSTVSLDKYEDSPTKFSRDKFDHFRHRRGENSGPMKLGSKEAGNVSPAKQLKTREERKPRFNKCRNYNMREKERKNINLQLNEDIVYKCNTPQHMCQNWRCDHNRLSSMSQSRIEITDQRRDFKPKNSKQQTRLHSPPSCALVQDTVKINSPVVEDCNSKQTLDVHENISEVILCNNEESNLSVSSNSLCGGDDHSESSFSSSPNSKIPVLSQRLRLVSECSIDSEDSSVVFERDSNAESSDESESGSDYSSECDSDEDCDEVDFCYIDSTNTTGNTLSDTLSVSPDRLKDINSRWHKENDVLPKKEKIPGKVHFPQPDKLATVHHMIHWPFAYREARRGPWEEIGRDRCRFHMRIQQAERDLSHVLDPVHRSKIWKERMCDVAST